MYCDVLMEDRFFFHETLTYRCPKNAKVGMRVSVNMRGRERIGFILKVYETFTGNFEVKEVSSLIDEEPIINEELFHLAHYMAKSTVSPLISCFQTILPSQLRPSSSFVPIKMQRRVRFVKKESRLSENQEKFLNELSNHQSMTYTQARKKYPNLKSLIRRGLIEEYEIESMYEYREVKKQYHKPVLKKEQCRAIESVEFNRPCTYLLHGVTGSGKTEVFLELAEKALERNQDVLIMVPEISLTPQMIQRVSERFSEDVIIYHSGLNNQEKYEQYKRLNDSDGAIVVGTRSSVFLPFKNLGLIVMDEEHDTSYKQENTPYYHARDIAIWRSEYHQCPLLLASASPSLDSYARALKDVYKLIEMPKRINDSHPLVTIVDLNKSQAYRKGSLMSEELKEAIKSRLQHKEQVILLLNRRSYLPILRDVETQKVLECPNCDLSLKYHKFNKSLKCHICNYQIRYDPSSMQLMGQGFGTERLEEYITEQFPYARVLRMDADTTTKKGAHKTLLDSFYRQEYDILIGTQMIAKGLDNPNVTLVGILNADQGLLNLDYRSVEETFSLILQASGRSGRGKKDGEVILQTLNPNHYAIQYAVNEKYKHFFAYEMKYRKIAKYPPYEYLISVVFHSENEEEAVESSMIFKEFIKEQRIRILGPSDTKRIARRYRSTLILKGRSKKKMTEACFNAIHKLREVSRCSFIVDVDPLRTDA